jgi:hypothetical protein
MNVYPGTRIIRFSESTGLGLGLYLFSSKQGYYGGQNGSDKYCVSERYRYQVRIILSDSRLDQKECLWSVPYPKFKKEKIPPDYNHELPYIHGIPGSVSGSGFAIRISIQEGRSRKNQEISCLEMLDVLF